MTNLPYHVDSYYPPHVGGAERRRTAEVASKRMAAQGWRLQPVTVEGVHIAKGVWGKAWCDNIDAWQEHASRLANGRGYLRDGAVINLRIEGGMVTALVQGTKLYHVGVDIKPLPPAKRARLKDLSTAGPGSPELAALLLPSSKELKMRCDCPDWSGLCKHLAAALYGIGVRLDGQPELLLALRGVDPDELSQP